MKLKTEPKNTPEQRDKYDKCNDEQRISTNDRMQNALKQNRHTWDEENTREGADRTRNQTLQLKTALEEATTELPKTSKKKRKVAFSEETEKLLAERQEMIDQRNIQGYEELTKAFRKSKQAKNKTL